MWDIKASINQILNIKVGDIDLDNGIIKLGDELRKVDLHDEMKRCIRAEKKDKADTDFLFATETGKRIHPGQLVRNMKAASKLAKLPIIISPKILAAHSKAYAKKISEEKCNRLEAKFFEQCYLYLKNCKWSCEIKQKDL
jgi:integrase